MAFKFALIAAAAASRIARQADTENERLIKECRDTRPWINCIQAYSHGECSGLGGGCDRTCGMCKTDACYDRIPMPHVKMFEDGVPARAMWPTLSNRNGENSFPRRNTTEVAEFPWENGSFSTFCLKVFTDGLCDSYDSLSINYDDETSIFLSGQPSEYCAFTCGVCSQNSEEPSIAKCFTDHNNIMFALAGENRGGPSISFTESPDEGSETTTEGPEGTEAPETEGESTTVPWWENWSIRKRRSALAIEKRDVIVSAIESILSNPENARKRRSLSFDFGFDDFEDFFNTVPEPFTNLAEGLESCNDMLVKNLDDEFIYEEYMEEIEDPDVQTSPLQDIVDRRQPKDFFGIRQYFSANSEDLTVNVDQCEWLEIELDEEIEDLAGIELTYDCQVSCPAGYALEIQGESSDDQYIRINCSKDGKTGTNMLKDSICESAMYCPNHLCQKIACVKAEEEEEESESFSEFDWGM